MNSFPWALPMAINILPLRGKFPTFNISCLKRQYPIDISGPNLPGFGQYLAKINSHIESPIPHHLPVTNYCLRSAASGFHFRTLFPIPNFCLPPPVCGLRFLIQHQVPRTQHLLNPPSHSRKLSHELRRETSR